MNDAELYPLAERAGRHLSSHQLKLVTAESCTGGGLAQCITAIPGSSDWFECGFVVYSNDAKHRLLGVEEQIIAQYGAVSEPTVRALTLGALQHCPAADVAVAISGIAGPGGGTGDKPVGTVWLAWTWRDAGTRVCRLRLEGDRQSVRRQAIAVALRGLSEGTTPGDESMT